MIEKLLKEEYWPMGYYGVVDDGETAQERPDIAVLKPMLSVTVDRNGNELRGPNAYLWDYTSVVAVEVEMSPQKSREQVLKNYRKNKAFYAVIRFVVTSDDHAGQLAKILGEEPTADPVKYMIDVVEYESLNVIKPKEAPQDVKRAPEPNGKLGVRAGAVLDYILSQGFKVREDIAHKLRGVGTTISKRSVSRVLKSLVEKGFLTTVGNGYEPTELARARPKQGTL